MAKHRPRAHEGPSPRRARVAALGGVLALACGLGTRSARAEVGVEVSSGLTAAGGARLPEPDRAPVPVFSLALRADVLFGRVAQRMWAVGPYVSLRTDNFGDFAPSLGVSLLIPTLEIAPVVLSAGVAARWDTQGGYSTAALQRAWWGLRSFNFTGPYTWAVGVFIEVREFDDAAHTIDVIAGIDLDFEMIALPFIGLASVATHRR